MVVVTGVTGVTGVSLAPQQRPHHVETGRGPAHSLPASHRGRHPEVWRQWDSAGRGGAGPLSDVQLSSDGGLPLQHQVVSGRPGILQIYPRRFVENHALLLLTACLDSPPYTLFLLSGLVVDDLSSPTHIILNNISLATSGRYKCEVSGGPPRFQTDESVTELQVVGKTAGLAWTASTD